jgi:hypothetical protein
LSDDNLPCLNVQSFNKTKLTYITHILLQTNVVTPLAYINLPHTPLSLKTTLSKVGPSMIRYGNINHTMIIGTPQSLLDGFSLRVGRGHMISPLLFRRRFLSCFIMRIAFTPIACHRPWYIGGKVSRKISRFANIALR